jgi:hypothetical protein
MTTEDDGVEILWSAGLEGTERDTLEEAKADAPRLFNGVPFDDVSIYRIEKIDGKETRRDYFQSISRGR